MAAEFDKYADNYREIINDVSHISGERYEYFIELRVGLMKEKLAGGITEKTRILDFGCGTGITEIFLKNAFPLAEIWGIDASPVSIEAAQKLGAANVAFLVSEEAALPFADGHFDLIYSNGTFHHIGREKHAEVLRELRRVLKVGGELFIFENNPLNPFMMRAMAKNPFDSGTKALNPGYLVTLLRDAEYKVDAANYYFFFPNCLRYLRGAEKCLRQLPLGAQYFVRAAKVR